ncbi:MAG: RNA-binding transcriptional accessory protein [Candidatus Eisenbacteria bacterium]|nr:RNA-binding transcriptional accessory protein [Candidatus Eisenbacteria bacterium]
MNEKHLTMMAQEFELPLGGVRATATLLMEGATIPFVARYRKEATGGFDEVEIRSIRDRLEQLTELDKRREAILKSLEERDLLTDELREQILAAETLATLEDIYLPFRPKRRTRATIAREKGLDPLAQLLLAQTAHPAIDPESEAAAFIDEEKGVLTVEEALAGARDIIAETVSEDMQARSKMRELFITQGAIQSKIVTGKEEAGAKFKDYYDWREMAAAAPSHRVLAMFRGENEGFLRLSIAPPEEAAEHLLRGIFVKGSTPASEQVALAVEDGYHRLLGPSMETEIRAEMKRRADEEAIRVFGENLRELLLAPLLGEKRVLALDPGYRTGCKVACLDAQGGLLHNETIFPHTSKAKAQEAERAVRALCETYKIEAIAVGNGTAGRETEAFVRKLDLPSSIAIVLVNESGASVYSASDVAREEFPDHDVTVRGAVSIGRRLMDPLAELVKIDPKSIGVGQYQHDVDQTALKLSLDDSVISCVNAVGVDVNTASKQLLTYVSGLGPQLAGNILTYRRENGPFHSRMQLKKVQRLGPKAFEQCAGFLRIRDGENPLDASAVHPESYHVVEQMTRDLGCGVADLIQDASLRAQISLKKYLSDSIGMPTLKDIMDELAKPGRDPRKTFEIFNFEEGVHEIEDLTAGMKLPGIITNVTAFGAFVDVGVHQDGLVHISQLADRFIKNPAEIVKVQQRVQVTVLEVDLKRRRISLSMRKDPPIPKRREQD